MADINTLQTKIQGLIDKSNATTNGTETTLNGAVNSLINGYGKNINAELGDYFSKTLTKLEPEDFGPLTTISEHFFESQGELTRVNLINSNVNYINEYAFYNCAKLKELYLPDNCQVSHKAFKGCDLSSMPHIMTLTYVGEESFANTNLKISDFRSFGWINTAAFANSPGPNRVIVIAGGGYAVLEHAFENCSNLETFLIDNPVRDYIIGPYAFAGSNLTNVIYEGTISEFHNTIFPAQNAFSGTNVKSIMCWDGSIPVEVYE